MMEFLKELPMAAKLALLALPILPNLWCIWQAVHREYPSQLERMLWGCAGVFLPVIGGLLYLLIGRHRAGQQTRLNQPPEA